MMAQAYNISYLGGRVQEDCDLSPAWAKKFGRPALNQYLNVVPHTCHLQLCEEAQTGSQVRPAWAQNETLSQKCWQNASSGRQSA
jgi:hypothetical protein